MKRYLALHSTTDGTIFPERNLVKDWPNNYINLTDKEKDVEPNKCYKTGKNLISTSNIAFFWF